MFFPVLHDKVLNTKYGKTFIFSFIYNFIASYDSLWEEKVQVFWSSGRNSIQENLHIFYI